VVSKPRMTRRSLPAWLHPWERTRLERFRREVRRALGPRLVDLRLYGSRARGEGHVRSDLDVLVLVRRGSSEIVGRVYEISDRIAADEGFPESGDVSPTIIDRAEWRFLLDRELLFGAEVQRDGIPI
jgi:predicted nucleotidyltransferase